MDNTELECRICHNRKGNKPFTAKERMLGLNDEFEYFECSNCMCLQIKEIPSDMDRYYPAGYYSYQQPVFATELTGIRYFLKKSLAGYYTGKFNLTGFILSKIYGNPFTWLRPNIVNFNSKILDVGCGKGRLLLSMKRSGYQNLTGIDPYNSEDIRYENGVNVYKKDVFEMEGQFDLVMLHHSFEHMDSPKTILERLGHLINSQGIIIIRIPVANCYAWRKYQSHWLQLDAPRHFFLHTVKSMTILAKECGLCLDSFEFESSAFQFTGSEKYLRNFGFTQDNSIFTKKQLKSFAMEAKRLNQLNDGDSAGFYLRKA
jgi:2-polyprenyl-3-methyl-5-hydroxy-6-metoxy-1,4-benzoquinol methylase